jgi:hypothetical protein
MHQPFVNDPNPQLLSMSPGVSTSFDVQNVQSSSAQRMMMTGKGAVLSAYSTPFSVQRIATKHASRNVLPSARVTIQSTATFAKVLLWTLHFA